MRLIDTDELMAQMKEYHERQAEEANMTGDRAVCVTWHDAIILIKNAPAVDAVPVIRCKDCKYYEEQDETIGTCLLTESGAHIKGYCSWAEVKEE